MPTDVYRGQEFRERCVRCEAQAVRQCGTCQVWVCDAHAGRRLACCESCEATHALSVTRAGKVQRGVGAILILIAAVWAYFFAAYHFANPALWVALFGLGGVGSGFLGWSLVAPAIARRRLEKSLGDVKALPPAT